MCFLSSSSDMAWGVNCFLCEKWWMDGLVGCVSDNNYSDWVSFQWLIFYSMLMLYLVTVVTGYGVSLNSFCIVGEWGMDSFSINYMCSVFQEIYD